MTNLEMNQNIADFIGTYCSSWNISLTKFAEKCNIPYMTIKRIMTCNVQKIDVYTITKIAEATRTPIMEILGLDPINTELYKRITHSTSQDRQILTYVLDILEKLHISGMECREIPYTDLNCDHKSYLLDPHLFRTDGLDTGQMEKLTFRSSFYEGMNYYGFRLPDNRLHPHFEKNNVLLVRKDDPADKEIGVFAWKDEGYIRLIFHRMHQRGRYTDLEPITGLGKTYRIDNNNVADLMNWVKLGVVTGVIR